MSDLFGNHIVGFSTRWLNIIALNQRYLYFYVKINEVPSSVFADKRIFRK